MNIDNSLPQPELRDIPVSAPAAPAADHLPLDLLDPPLRGQIDWVQRRYGLDPVTACLATLLSVLCATGPSRRVLSPIDDSFLPPAFSVVLHGDTIALGAAVNLSLDPLRRWLLARIGHPDKRDLRRARLRLADLHRDRTHLELELGQPEPEPTPFSFGAMNPQEAARSREQTRTKLETTLVEIEKTTFRLLPHALVDDALVSQLLAPGRLSLDGAVLAASLSGEAASGWTAAAGPEKTALARVLNASWRGWPQAGDEQTHACPLLSAVLVTEPEGACTLWQDKGLVEVNRHLFYVGTDAEPAFDLDAKPDEEAEDFCGGVLQPLVNARLTGRVLNYALNEAATTHFQAFLRQVLMKAKSLSSNEGRRRERAPILALKFALLVHIASPAQSDEIIDVPTVEFACRLADAVCARDLEFVRRTSASLVGQTPEKVVSETARLSALVNRLKLRGPLRWRLLLRGCHQQKAESLEMLLSRGIAAGLIRQEGDRYCAVEQAEVS